MKLPRAKYFVPTRTLMFSLLKLCLFPLKKNSDTELFEQIIGEKWNVKYSCATSSFRIGLYHSLKALDLKPDDEVLLTPITIPDTVNAIHVLGLKPQFVDLQLSDHNIDLADMRKVITNKTRVLLVTHLAGIAPDIESIIEEAKRHNLFVIEDFSQAYGAGKDGRYLGSYGDIGIGSLSIGKNITSLVGGIIITNDSRMMGRIKSYMEQDLQSPRKLTFLYQLVDNIKINLITSSWGFSFLFYYILWFIFLFRPEKMSTVHERKYIEKYIKREIFFDDVPKLRSYFPVDFFFWFSNWQAKLALKTLSRFEESNRQRQSLAKILFDNLDDHVREMVPFNKDNFWQNTYYHFPINVDGSRDDLQRYLFKKGIDCAGYGLTLCSEEPIFSKYSRKTVVAHRIKKSSLFMPVHEDFTNKEMIKIARAVNEFFS